MPLYEYKCAKCDEVIEVIQKFSDAPLTVHESCGGGLERLLGKPALQFKGSGFYITDYKQSGSSPGKNGGGKSSKSESKPETKSESKSESTPASAPAKKD